MTVRTERSSRTDRTNTGRHNSANGEEWGSIENLREYGECGWWGNFWQLGKLDQVWGKYERTGEVYWEVRGDVGRCVMGGVGKCVWGVETGKCVGVECGESGKVRGGVGEVCGSVFGIREV